MPLASVWSASRTRRSLVLAALFALVLASTGAAPSALAATPVPSTPDHGATIDAYSGYEPETTCSPTEKPGTKALRDLVVWTYGSAISSNIVRPCSSSDSGHEEGRSLDWMTNARVAEQKAMADTLVEWMRASDQYGNRHAMARRLGVMYVVWNNKMWRAYDPDRVDSLGNFTGGWTTYSVGGKPCTELTSTTYDNSCHRNHVHISLGWNGANAKTSYYVRPSASSVLSCPVPAAPGVAPAPATSRLGYVPVKPARVLDTRKPLGVGAACTVGAGKHIDVQVTGRGGIPSTGVAAVALNIISTRGTDDTWVAAFPAGTSFGGTTSLRVQAGRSRAATVVVNVGARGRVSLLNGSGSTYLIADVAGYFPAAGGGGHSYVDRSPRRLLDTRSSTPLAERTPRSVTIRGRAGIPSAASVVVLNVTVPSPSSRGYLSVTPTAPASTPTTSTVHFTAGEPVSNRAFAPIGPDGSISLWGSVSTDVVLDVVGWYQPDASGDTRFVPLVPKRVLDSRTGSGLQTFSGTDDTQRVMMAGRAGVPDSAQSLVVTLTATGASRSTYLTAWAGGASAPSTSDVYVAPGAKSNNLAVVPLGADGSISLRNAVGEVDLVVELLGYNR